MKAMYLLFIGLISTTVLAQTPLERLESSPRHHEWVDVKSGDKVIKSFLVYPEVSENVTTVVVIHENRGLNDWARSLADQIAEAGYIALAPDLLSGKGPNGEGTASFPNSDAARTAIYELDKDQVVKDILATIGHAQQLKAGNGKVVVIGFCWGGSQSFQIATVTDQIEAAIVCYGTAPKEPSVFKNINVPVYGFYGGNDNRVNATIPDTEKIMKELGKVYEPVIYDGAGHGFFRSGEATDASDDNKVAREQAWIRLKKILEAI